MSNQKYGSLDEWVDPYKDKWTSYLDQLENREPFSYNVNNDAMYHQLKDQYVQQGQMAMMDTMGQAAAMTGGYGNSFAQTAGQQTYNQYLGQLNEMVPELHNMAYNRYQQEGKDLLDKYTMYKGLSEDDYDKYFDLWDANFRASESQKNRDATQQANNYNKLYNRIAVHGYNPTDEELAAAGMTRSEVNEVLKANDPTAGYSRSGDWTTSPHTGVAYQSSTIKAVQEFLGLEPTGFWNKECEDAAKAAGFKNGLDGAYNAYKANPNAAGGRPVAPTTPGSDPYPQESYRYNTYDEATAALKQSGYGDNTMGLMTKSEWSRRKNNGGTGDEVTLFDSYEEYLEYYVEYASVPLKDRTWTLEDDGGINWFWGVDNNATVKDQFDNIYRLDDLVDAFVKSGMTKDQAKAKVKAIQSAVGA